MTIAFANCLFLIALLCLKSAKIQTVKCIACYKVHSEKAKKAYSPLSNQEVKYSKWQRKKENEIVLENDILLIDEKQSFIHIYM